MDKKEAEKEANEDSTRESLIAISYHLPDKDLDPKLIIPKKVNGESFVDGKNCVGAENYRSKLISISSTDLPDFTRTT